MATKEIAVDGCVVAPQGIVSGGTVTITAVPSVKCKAGGKGIYKNPLTFTFAGGNATGYDPGTVTTVGPGSISATAVKTKADGLLVMRVDDQNASVALTGTIGGTPTSFTGTFKITNAGQTKVKGN